MYAEEVEELLLWFALIDWWQENHYLSDSLEPQQTMKKEDLRPAVILGTPNSIPGYFHEWGTKISLDGGKAQAVTMAIFETNTGSVQWVDPNQIMFTDR